MKNFIKGFFVGIFNITPGLSGSVLLVVLNLYEKCINEISNIFKTPRKSIIFLTPIAIGVILGIFSFSNIIYLLINSYKKETFIVFTGFIFGTIPHLIKESTRNGFKESYLISFIITLLIGITMLFFKPTFISYNIDYNFLSILKYIFIGFLLSLSTIIPGISSTILLSIFNFYGIYIISITKLNLLVLCPIFIGFIIMTFILSKFISYLFKNYYGYTYFAILGFTIATIPTLLDFNIIISTNIIISIFLSIIAFLITNYFLQVQDE